MRGELRLSRQALRSPVVAVGALAGTPLGPAKSAGGGSQPVLVELGKFETHGRVVDRRRQRLEVGQRALAVAACLGDVGAGPQRLGRRVAIDRGVGHRHRSLERTRPPQRSRDSDEVSRRERPVLRLAVEP